MSRPRILCISLTPIVRDSRVLRQLAILAETADVTTVGFGPKPAGATEHLEIPESYTLPQTVSGVIGLTLRRYRAVELAAPAVKAARAAIGDRRFDMVVANEARALPLAFAVAGDAPVWGDMHEWAPGERTQVLSWRLLIAPYMRWVCRQYLPRAAAVTAVAGSIARLYDEQFGLHTELVRNASAFRELAPSAPVEGRIRLVHSGAAVPGRNIEALITGTIAAGDRFTLDLYLVQAGDGGAYWRSLRALAGRSDRITFHDAVKPDELVPELNKYDVGVYSVPMITTNHRYMLPNKFFDFVQARLALVFSPSEEIDALMARYGLGITSADASAEALTAALGQLTPEAVAEYKRHSDVAARGELSAAADEDVVRGIVARLLG
ncbi:MAG TPA: glycosyltransferase [Pseudolysinimonas sp.]|nr:glycosyltransferase [Pseudolysinimonas sp.]